MGVFFLESWRTPHDNHSKVVTREATSYNYDYNRRTERTNVNHTRTSNTITASNYNRKKKREIEKIKEIVQSYCMGMLFNLLLTPNFWLQLIVVHIPGGRRAHIATLEDIKRQQ